MSDQSFLAEASVLISPDLTAFRAKLIAELQAHTKGVVATVGVVAKQATTAATGAVGAAQATGAARQGAAAATSQLTAAETAYASALARTALLQKAGVTATSDTARARAQYTAAISANIAADRAWRAAILAGDEAQLKSAAGLFRRTAGIEAAANAALKAAVAEDARVASIRAAEAAETKATKTTAARTASLSRGVGTQALAFGGLRGAVLGAEPAFIAGAAAAIAFGAAVKSAADLQAELNVFKVTAQATGDEMVRVGEASRALGADITLPAVGASDAAEAMTELAKAGLSVTDSIDGARGVLQLATAAQLDNAAATNIAASAINAFGLAGTDASHIADVLANASIQAQGGIDEIGIALQQSAAVARQAGLSFEETAAVLTLLARNGLRGSDAGTSFRTALIRLINPSVKAAEKIKDLNLQIRDSSGAIRLDVFDQFTRATERMSAAQRDQTLAIIFGQDAIRAAAILAREGADGLEQIEGANNRAGAAAELAGARMAGLTGKIENLKNQLSALGLTIGQTVIPPLSLLADTAAESANEMNGVISDMQALIALGKEAASIFPIDFGGGGGDSLAPDPSFLKSIVPPQVAPFLEFRKQIRTILGTSANEGREQIQKLVEEMNKVGGLPAINKTVLDLRKLADELRKGDEESRELAKGIDAFVLQLQRVSVAPEIDPFELSIEIPPELLSGDPGRVAGEASREAFLKALKFEPSDAFGLGLFIQTAKQQGASAGDEWAAAFGKQMRAGLRQAAADSTGALNVLEGAALEIQIESGPQERQKLLANLDEQEQEARELVETRRNQLKPGQVSSPALRAAQADVKAILDEEDRIRGEITAEVEQAANDAKQDARDAQDAKSKADQAFLEALQPRRAAIDRQSQRAAGTPGLQDNVNAARALKQRLLREIEIIKASNLDTKTKTAEIGRRNDELIAAGQALTKARDDRAEALKKIAEDRTEKIRTAADALTASLGKAITLSGLRENESAERAAINAAIKFANFRVKNYKRLGLNLQDEQIALEELINQKDEVNKTKEKGTTAFDLLRENVETFAATGGSLINAQQPFTGPAGFSADVAQFLTRGTTPRIEVVGKEDSSAAARTRQVDQGIARLIEALDRNTAAKGGSGPSFYTARDATGWRPFRESGQASAMAEGRTQGGV